MKVTSLCGIYEITLDLNLFPGGAVIKTLSSANAGDTRSTSGLGRDPGEGNGNPLQYSCLENSMDRGAWWASTVGKETHTTERELAHCWNLNLIADSRESESIHRAPPSDLMK